MKKDLSITIKTRSTEMYKYLREFYDSLPLSIKNQLMINYLWNEEIKNDISEI